MKPFLVQRRIEFCDTDMAGIVHFSNFFRFMESAEVAYLRARGLSVTLDWEGRRLGFPRVSAHCDYVDPLRFGDLVDIAVTIEKLGEKSVTFAFAFSIENNIAANGRVTSVCCLVLPDHQLKAIPIPETYRARLLGDPLAG